MSETASEVIGAGIFYFIFFVVTGLFAFGGPFSFLSRGIDAVKQYWQQRKQPEKQAGIHKYLWKGTGLAVFDIVGTGMAMLLLASLFAFGPFGIIFAIGYLAYAAPSLLLWGVVLSCLYLRERRAPEGREKTKKRAVIAVLYFVLAALGVWSFFYLRNINGPLDL